MSGPPAAATASAAIPMTSTDEVLNKLTANLEPAQQTQLQQLQTEWSADPYQAFTDGVELAFERWECLQIVRDNMLAGNDTEMYIEEFMDEVIELFDAAADKQQKVYPDDISDWLSDVMSETFHLTVEDDSQMFVARLLCTLWDDCMERKDFTGLTKMAVQHQSVMQRLAQRSDTTQGGESTDGDDSDEESTSLSGSAQHMSLGDYARQQEEKKQSESKQSAEGDNAEDDGWSTVSAKPKKKGGK